MKTKRLLASVFFFSLFFTARAQDPFLGEIRMFAGNFAPRGWAFCDGQILSIAQNAALFSLLGTTYGGNGQTTFALPDLRGRFPMHEGSGPGLPSYTLGERSGNYISTLTTSNLPVHSHTGYIRVADTKGSNFYPANGYIADSSTVTFQQFTPTVPAGNKTIQGVQTNPTGGSQPFSIMNPYLTINFIIALQGIFPSRD